MSTYQDSDALAKLNLGKATEYIEHYDASLLQGLPRSLNRDQLNIHKDNIPFKGEDVWYSYELSWLNTKGKPVVAVAEFRFPCESPNIVESKSFKLYLNSFNQSVFYSEQEVTATLSKDLSACVHSHVSVSIFPVDNCPPLNIKALNAICIDDIDINISHYDLHDDMLTAIKSSRDTLVVEEQLVSHLLKSNCLITNQPDWASIYISYKGKAIKHDALLAYLISFRQHNEFHEQCVERIYTDLQSCGWFDSLTVFARYTRRGGLDINPFRSSNQEKAPYCRTLRQ